MALRLSQLPAGVQSFRSGRRPRSDEDDRRGRRRRPEARGRCLRYAGRRGEGDEAGGGGRFAPLRGTLKGWGSIGTFNEGENITKIKFCQVPAQIKASRVGMGTTTDRGASDRLGRSFNMLGLYGATEARPGKPPRSRGLNFDLCDVVIELRWWPCVLACLRLPNLSTGRSTSLYLGSREAGKNHDESPAGQSGRIVLSEKRT